MAGPLDAIIARGLSPIDPAGEFYKNQALQQENRVRMQALAQNAQLLPYKIAEAQQNAQINQMAIAKAQQDQESEAAYQRISDDPQWGRDPLKVHHAASLPGSGVNFTTLEKQGKILDASRQAEALRQETTEKVEDFNRKHDAEDGVTLAANGYQPQPTEALVHRLVDRNRLTKDEAMSILQNIGDPEARRQFADTLISKHEGVSKSWDDRQKATQARQTADITTAAQDADKLELDIKADPTHAPEIWKQFKTDHAGATKGMGDTFNPEYIPFLQSRPVPMDKRAEWMQARNTAAADAARTPEEWHKLIVAAVGPDRAPAVTAMVDAESNPTKKRLLIEKIGEQKPGAEDSLAREATNILAKPPALRTPEEKARLAAIQQQSTMNRPPPPDRGENLLVPNGQGGYTLTRVVPGQTVGPGAVTKSTMSSQNAPTTQMRNVAAQAQTVHEQMPNVIADIDRMKDRIGKVSGRWNEFMQGKVGMDDPDFAALRADLLMMSSAVALMHARGRLPENLRKEFETAINAPQQSADNLKAILTTIDRWTVANLNTMSGGKTAPAPSSGGGAAGGNTLPGGITLEDIDAEIKRRKANK